MVKEIQLRLYKLTINDINQTNNQIQTITKDKSEINKIKEQFKMSQDSIVTPPSTINAIYNINFISRKNYYSKPSFPNVQLEERNYQWLRYNSSPLKKEK